MKPLTKIVHRTRDCARIIVGVQHIDGPLQVKHGGGPDPCDPCDVDAYEHVYPKILGGQNTLAAHPIS